MNKLIYAIGLLSSVGISTGVLFKIMHWPFLPILFLISVIGLIFFFFPKLAWDVYTNKQDNTIGTKTRIISGFSSVFIILISILFKLQHFPGASMLLIIGFAVFVLIFLPLLFYYLANRSL